ncbi:MAG: dienelactone hydrolase family protein [Burkholderiales bacterium]|nr:dienelactone hydrolase family protein [Burkholderiales bacterium]
MIEKHLDIPTADGAMNSFVVYPDEGGPHPVALFYMDAPGKREELHDMARRLAATGYYVVLPNLYYRRSRDFWLKERNEAGMAEMFGHMRALDNAMVVRDTAALLKFVDAQPEANAKRIGAVGYCMSGPFVVCAAHAYPDRIHAIAGFHPANMVTEDPDSPHKLMPGIQCEAYYGCAEIDKWCPPKDVEVMRAALEQNKAPHRLEMYMGVEHGFTFPLRAGIYNQPAAERHWERLLALFRRTLGPA